MKNSALLVTTTLCLSLASIAWSQTPTRATLSGTVQNDELTQLEQAVRKNPSDPQAHYELGIAYVKRGREEEGLAEFKRVLEIEPNHKDALNNAAWILATSRNTRLSDIPAAVVYAERAAQLSDEKHAPILDTLAEAYFRAGRKSDAVNAIEKAIALEPQRAYYQKQRARFQAPPTVDIVVDGMTLAVPTSFQEMPELAQANQIYAPGRFEFHQGRAFYDGSSGTIVQVHSSDNPLVGMNYEKAQKKFLGEAGVAQPIVWRSLMGPNSAQELREQAKKAERSAGLSKRGWGLDTFANMFFPIPVEVHESTARTVVSWSGPNRNKEEITREMTKFMGSDGKLYLPMTISKSSPAWMYLIYLVRLTPNALVELKGDRLTYDVYFAPNSAVLGQVTMEFGDGSQKSILAFVVGAGGGLSQEEATSFSLPSDTVGKSPYFWWILATRKGSVFEAGAEPLYHIVFATFDDGNPPKLVDSLLKSLRFAKAETGSNPPQ